MSSPISSAVPALVARVLGAAFVFGLVRLKRPRNRQLLLGADRLPAVVPLLVIGISLSAVCFTP